MIDIVRAANGIYYKKFNIVDVFGTGKVMRLRGPFSRNEQLQKTGDRASIAGDIIICKSGWHAFRARQSAAHIRLRLWRRGFLAIYAVKLVEVYQPAERWRNNKVVARHIKMVRKVRYYSTEGRMLRSYFNKRDIEASY